MNKQVKGYSLKGIGWKQLFQVFIISLKPITSNLKPAPIKRGFTGVETIVWIAIFTASMMALTQTVLFFYKTANYSIQQASAIAAAQRGIDRMVRIIRETSYASNGAYPIVSMGTSSIVIYANIDRATPLVHRVRFYLEGTTLKQGIITPEGDPSTYTGTEVISPVTEYVRNIPNATTTFYYYDENGAGISDYTQVARVRYVIANLIVDVVPATSPTQLTLRSSTALRNLVGR